MLMPYKQSWSRALLTGFAVTVFTVSITSFASTSGSFEDEEIVISEPEQNVKSDDKDSEAAFRCKDGNCKGGAHKNEIPKPIDTGRSYTSSQREACYRNHLLSVAKTKVRNWYGNRGYSVGKCALGVRSIMTAAGMNPIGALGDAYHWKRDGMLRRLGFKDIYYPGMRPDQAPPGAILIFRGPLTLASNAVLPPRRLRRGRGAGNWVGHVAIKGDNGFYYTDGRTSYPAVRNRVLAGVFVPESCARCNSSLKRACGG